MDLEKKKKITIQAVEAIQSVAGFIQDEVTKVNPQDIETKSLNSLVSYVDKTAEIQLVEKLGAILPDATFLTEEETVENNQSKLRWIIDPLDGTTNFLHQIPFFAISVALENNGEIICGIVHEISRSETFYAWQSGGAFLNGEKIQVSQRQHLGDALIATGFPYYDYDGLKPYFSALEFFMKNTRGIRRLGSAALDLSYVACGRFDAYYEYSLKAWDVAAGALLVQEAGGKVSDFSGKDDYIFGQQIIAASPFVFDQTLKTVQGAFSKNR